MKFVSKHFHSRKYVWKCRLRNGGHLSRPQCDNHTRRYHCWSNLFQFTRIYHCNFYHFSRISICTVSSPIVLIRWAIVKVSSMPSLPRISYDQMTSMTTQCTRITNNPGDDSRINWLIRRVYIESIISYHRHCIFQLDWFISMWGWLQNVGLIVYNQSNVEIKQSAWNIRGRNM